LATQQFCFPIPNQKEKIYQVIAYGILLFNLLMVTMSLPGEKNYLLQVLVQLMVFVFLVVLDVRNHRKNKKLLPLGILMLAYAVFWIRFGFNFAFVANLILWGLYTVSRRKFSINIDTEKIMYPSFPKKNMVWADMNNIILKDDILTIDCKNNKVYQHFIEDSGLIVNEQEFNEFCRSRLSPANS
jgi:hypothetical protein